MGSPKHALSYRVSIAGQSTHQPLLLTLLLCHHEFQLALGLTTSDIYVVARDESQRHHINQLLALHDLPHNMKISNIVDDHTVSGPTAGLLAAYTHDQAGLWLVTGCDYPLLSVASLKQLYTSHMKTKSTLSCFVNNEGFAEPLLAIWTPVALKILCDLASSAQREGRRLGPTQVVRILQHRAPQTDAEAHLHENTHVNLVEPFENRCLTNVNTLEEWHLVRNMLENTFTASERTD